MSNDTRTPFERAVTPIASKQPELQPAPHPKPEVCIHGRPWGSGCTECVETLEYWRRNKPPMRSDRLHVELQAARAKCAEFRVLLADIAEHLSHGAALHAGSLIFEEDAPAIEVISKAIAKD